MRVSNRSRWICIAAVSWAASCGVFASGIWAQAPGSYPGSAANAQEAYGFGEYGGYGPAASGGEAGFGEAAKSPPHGFWLIGPDGVLEQLTASRVYIYQMEPEAAKPKLMGKNIDEGTAKIYGRAGGGGMGGVNPMQSMMGMGAMNPYGPGDARADKRSQVFAFYAFILDELESESPDQDSQPMRARVKVALPASRPQQSLGSMPGAEGMEMSSEGGSMEYGNVFQEIDRMAGDRKTLVQQVYGDETLKNLAGLIRLDVWIEDARSTLQTKRNDPKVFRATETYLRELLSEEYDALLAKQRADAERLRKRLDQLQADIERRANAKDRVVDVQLGKLVLEAQGLLDTRQ